MSAHINQILHGDCRILLQTFPSDCVDVGYCDPPFCSQRDYSEFTDTFPSMAAYLEFMRAILQQYHRVIKPTGSMFLHCDGSAVYHLKPLMDEIFGENNFVNEIIWCYSGGGTPTDALARKHDTILFYAKKNSDRFFCPIYVPYKPFKPAIHSNGTPYRKEGKLMEDWWADILPVGARLVDRYPTQKPIALLERIITISSKRGDVVLDGCCGSGTTLVAAKQLRRRWIGMDLNDRACKKASARVKDASAPPSLLDFIGGF